MGVLNEKRCNTNKQSIVLLGDSILKNNAYTNGEKSIQDLLKERTNNKTHCFAMDDSKINDVYNQINNIPDELNSPYTTLFLSAGGNNILSKYVENNADPDDSSLLEPIFTSYEHLVKSIRRKMNKSKIILLDIYYPENQKYKQYHTLINKWNNKIYTFTKDSKNNVDGVLRVSSIITKPDDFSQKIEPSSVGGEKLVDAILNF